MRLFTIRSAEEARSGAPARTHSGGRAISWGGHFCRRNSGGHFRKVAAATSLAFLVKSYLK
jgi:hypothetical protein